MQQLFFMCDLFERKKKQKKKNKKNANTKPSYVSQSFETYTNILKPSVSLPRLL